MRPLSKFAATAALTGALAIAAVTASQARWHGDHWHNGAAIGFGAGAVVGAAAASAAYPGYDYAYAPGPYYDYGPSYAYAGDSYTYAPALTYDAAPDYGYYNEQWGREHSTNNFSIDSQR